MTELLSGLPSLQAYLLLAATLFCIGVWGLINSRNAVRVLMSIELMLNGVNINLMAFSSYIDGDLIRGQVFAVFVITVAAASCRRLGDFAFALPQQSYRRYGTVQPAPLVTVHWGHASRSGLGDLQG